MPLEMGNPDSRGIFYSHLLLGSVIECCCFQTIIQGTVGCSGGGLQESLPKRKPTIAFYKKQQ